MCYDVLFKAEIVLAQLAKADEEDLLLINALLRELATLVEQIDAFEDIEADDLPQFLRIREPFLLMQQQNGADKSLLRDLLEIVERAIGRTIPLHQSRFPAVEDVNFRDNLHRDLLDVEACLSRGLWKPAMVLSGSILEAAMLEFLRRNPAWTMDGTKRKAIPTHNGVSKDIIKDDFKNQWTLAELIGFFCENHLLDAKPTEWRTTLDNFVRKYRNLVHPAAEARKEASQRITEAAARQCHANVLSALEVISELETPG